MKQIIASFTEFIISPAPPGGHPLDKERLWAMMMEDERIRKIAILLHDGEQERVRKADRDMRQVRER
jgi:hypothetical protein